MKLVLGSILVVLLIMGLILKLNLTEVTEESITAVANVMYNGSCITAL